MTRFKYPLPNTDSGNVPDIQNAFVQFMVSELGNEWYTEDVDFVSANISSLSVSPAGDPTNFITVTSNGIESVWNTIADGGSTSMEDGARLSQHWAEDNNGTEIDGVVDYNGAQALY